MANCSLSKLQICAFTVTRLQAERLLESHLKLASANGPRSIENLWQKATDCKIWTKQIRKSYKKHPNQFKKKLTFGDFYLDQPKIYNIPIYTQLEYAGTPSRVSREAIKSQDALFKRLSYLEMLQSLLQLMGWDLKFRWNLELLYIHVYTLQLFGKTIRQKHSYCKYDVIRFLVFLVKNLGDEKTSDAHQEALLIFCPKARLWAWASSSWAFCMEWENGQIRMRKGEKLGI